MIDLVLDTLLDEGLPLSQPNDKGIIGKSKLFPRELLQFLNRIDCMSGIENHLPVEFPKSGLIQSFSILVQIANDFLDGTPMFI